MTPGRTTDKSDSINKEKQRRFQNQIQQFENDNKKVKKGEEKAFSVDDRMETALSNIDETITTLQTRRESVKKKKKQRKKKYGKKNLKEIKKQDFHDLKMFEHTEELQEIAEEISDWRAYQIEIQDLSRRMLRDELDKRLNDEVDVEAAKRYVEVVEDKIDDIESHVDSRVEDQKEMITNRIDAEVSKEKAETEARVAGVEKDVQYLKEEVMQSMQTLTETLQEVAKQTESDKRNHVTNAAEKTNEVKNNVQKGSRAEQLREEVGDVETVEEEPEISENEFSQNTDSEPSPIEGTTVGTGEKEEQEESSEDDGPRYKFKRRAWSEMKQTFIKVQEDFDAGRIYPEEETLSYRKVADYSDVGKDSIKSKIEDVREEFDDREEPICPDLGNPEQ